MKIKFSKSVNLSLVIGGILGGALIAIAVTPLVQYPPTTNDTVVNFDALRIGYFLGEVDGRYETATNGQTFLTHFLPGLFTTDEAGYLLPLRFGTEIDSENAGLYSLGHYVGLMGRAVLSNGLFGRVGVEGRVTGPSSQARGFAGYLEYDSSLNPTTENDINIDSLPSASPSVALLNDYIRISKGIPWAFFTENKSKFKEDVLITGQLIADTEPIVFADETGPISNPVVEINPFNSTQGDLEADRITAQDFIATDDLSSRFFMVSDTENFNGKANNAVFPVDVECPWLPYRTIRLGCGGAVLGSQGGAPYLGAEQVSTRGCKAYARKPVETNLGQLAVYAYCFRPE